MDKVDISPIRNGYHHSRGYRRSRSRSPSRGRSRSPSYSRGRSPRHRNRRLYDGRMRPGPCRVLGVFGMSYHTTSNDLKRLFGKYGRIESVQIVSDHYTGRSRGFGFIYFASTKDATRAKEHLQDQRIDGTRVRIDYSVTNNGGPSRHDRRSYSRGRSRSRSRNRLVSRSRSPSRGRHRSPAYKRSPLRQRSSSRSSQSPVRSRSKSPIRRRRHNPSESSSKPSRNGSRS